MKVFEVRDGWSMENLQLCERPLPQVVPGTVLLRMKAASLNFRDLLVPLRGYGALTGELPLIPGTSIGTLIELAEYTVRADKVITF